jgi:hypothetical protein
MLAMVLGAEAFPPPALGYASVYQTPAVAPFGSIDFVMHRFYQTPAAPPFGSVDFGMHRFYQTPAVASVWIAALKLERGLGRVAGLAASRQVLHCKTAAGR